MMTKETYLQDAQTMDGLSIRMTQLHALSRVIEDTSRLDERDDYTLQTSLWLRSDLLSEVNDTVTSLHKSFLTKHRPNI